MAFIPGIFIFLAISIIIGILIISAFKKGVSGIKVMILGLNLTLFGGIIAVDTSSNLGGIEYLIALLGLILSIIGLGKKD